METKNYLELQNKEKIITQNFGNVGECYVEGNFYFFNINLFILIGG